LVELRWQNPGRVPLLLTLHHPSTNRSLVYEAMIIQCLIDELTTVQCLDDEAMTIHSLLMM
jgi:hypothetical protein